MNVDEVPVHHLRAPALFHNSILLQPYWPLGALNLEVLLLTVISTCNLEVLVDVDACLTRVLINVITRNPRVPVNVGACIPRVLFTDAHVLEVVTLVDGRTREVTALISGHTQEVATLTDARALDLNILNAMATRLDYLQDGNLTPLLQRSLRLLSHLCLNVRKVIWFLAWLTRMLRLVTVIGLLQLLLGIHLILVEVLTLEVFKLAGITHRLSPSKFFLQFMYCTGFLITASSLACTEIKSQSIICSLPYII
jgi:hypothetical protein